MLLDPDVINSMMVFKRTGTTPPSSIYTALWKACCNTFGDDTPEASAAYDALLAFYQAVRA